MADVTLSLDLPFMLHLECHPDLDLLRQSGAALLEELKVGIGRGHMLLVEEDAS